jgi:ADP-ribose pyrophosphatase
MIKQWPIIETAEGPDMGLFCIRRHRCRSPRTGEEHDFYVIDFPDWVQVIPITPENQVIMVRQYRHGCGRTFLELPGGLIESGDTSPVETAMRELQEETGYQAKDLVLLMKTFPQPAVLNHAGYTYVARGVKKVAEPKLDAGEDIEVCLVGLNGIPEMIRKGEITHGQTVMAMGLYFLLER